MKTFHTLEIVKAPLDEVWRAIRDRLDELVPHLDDVQSVVVEHREELPDGSVRLINLWRGKANIPAVLNSVIKPELLAWTDRAVWNLSTRECAWQIEMHFDRERTKCRGVTKFEPAIGGKGTRVTFSGEFAMNAKGMRGVPAFLESTVEAGVEAFVTSLIPRNFRKLVQAAGNVLTKGSAA
ncbi:MAG TPA: SRPBCC family protein [Bryobacteraceae bacterium]|jgi:hypothetical protein|nr:SRPBCC family protein [Bryobacteraceae bacterium]